MDHKEINKNMSEKTKNIKNMKETIDGLDIPLEMKKIMKEEVENDQEGEVAKLVKLVIEEEEDQHEESDQEQDSDEDIGINQEIDKKARSISTFTLTFGDQAENHVGMQKIGKLANKGFSLDDLKKAKTWFDKKDATTELIELHTLLPEDMRAENKAYVLVVKDGLSKILGDAKGADKFFMEQKALNYDKEVFMYGRVVNKHARWNLCFSDFSQEPDYENKKGRIIKFDHVPLLKKSREMFKKILGDIASDLAVEGNYYFDTKKCGIGYHGDSERRKVIGVRVGAQIPLRYVWFKEGESITPPMHIELDHGDIYFMSEKAVGTDWKRKKIPTLRHAAGAYKYIDKY